MSKTVVSKTTETKFTKDQMLGSQQFSTIHKDVINAILEEDQLYSINQAKQRIEEFEKKEAR